MHSDTTDSKIRQKYILIFEWHQENGRSTIDTIIQSNQAWNRDNDNLDEYTHALNMPHPENASLEEMYLVAKKVLCGILEWNYQVKVGNDLVLGDIARNIIELYNEIEQHKKAEQLSDKFYDIKDYYIRNEFEYFAVANEIYKDVLLDNEKNIGGRVALADTNWEMQKLRNNGNQLFFRKPIALNLKAVPEEEDNLFQLAFNGKISIINITVK